MFSVFTNSNSIEHESR